MAALVFSVLVTLLGVGFLWFYVARPILEDYGVIAPRAVNDYEDARVVMSRVMVQTAQTNRTDEPDGRGSEAEEWMDRLEVDRTKTTLIEICVYSGWTVAEIRSILKGDNGILGTEIEAARKRLGVEPPAQHVTPFAGRPTSARFEQPTDADYPYKAPA